LTIIRILFVVIMGFATRVAVITVQAELQLGVQDQLWRSRSELLDDDIHLYESYLYKEVQFPL